MPPSVSKSKKRPAVAASAHPLAAKRAKSPPCKGDDSCLQRLARTFVKHLSKEEAASICSFFRARSAQQNGFLVGSMFSGSEVQLLAGSAIAAVACEMNADHNFKNARKVYKLAWSCDIDKVRQRWILEFTRPIIDKHSGERDSCCFHDASELHNGMATCVKHGRKCTVEKVLCLLGGFSCKDLITLTSHAGSGRTNQLEGGAGTTAKTFGALIDFLAQAKTPIYVGDNLDEIAKPESINKMLLQERFADIGYQVGLRIYKSSDFGSPTRRERAFILALHVETLGINKQEAKGIKQEAKGIIAKVFSTMDKMKRATPCSLDDFLLRDTDPYVQGMLAARQMGVKDIEKSAWREAFDKTRRTEQLRYSDCVVPAAQRASPWFLALTETIQAHLGFVLRIRPDATSADLSQSIGRGLVSSNKDELPAMLPRHSIWDMNRKRLVSGLESLLIIGFDEADLDVARLRELEITDSSMKDLAGNAFTGQVVLALLIALFGNLPSKSDSAFKQYLDSGPASFGSVAEANNTDFLKLISDVLG